jgi:VanZ family protein
MSEHLVRQSLSVPSRIIRYWIPVALMLSVMYFFSTDLFSSENTRRAIAFLTHWFGDDLSGRDLGEANYVVRKFMHFFEYAILATLLFRAFRAESPMRWRFSWSVYAFVVVVTWALLDEFHQSFTRSRGGSIYDSMIDSSGGLFALLMITFLSKRKERRRHSIS